MIRLWTFLETFYLRWATHFRVWKRGPNSRGTKEVSRSRKICEESSFKFVRLCARNVWCKNRSYQGNFVFVSNSNWIFIWWLIFPIAGSYCYFKAPSVSNFYPNGSNSLPLLSIEARNFFKYSSKILKRGKRLVSVFCYKIIFMVFITFRL